MNLDEGIECILNMFSQIEVSVLRLDLSDALLLFAQEAEVVKNKNKAEWFLWSLTPRPLASGLS